MRNQIQALIDSDFSAYRVSKDTGISLSVVQKILHGTSKLDNISLKNAETLAAYWEANQMKDYKTVVKAVREALNDGTTYNLAIAFTGERYRGFVEMIVVEAYSMAVNGIDDFNMTVEEYLFEMLDSTDHKFASNMQPADTFETAKEAEDQGFFWEDSIDRWLKLA